jgi:predicted transcriptional regulator
MDMTFKLEIEVSQRGLRMFLKDWQEEAMRVLWGNPQKGLISREVFDQVNQRLSPGSISRASIINFLEDMASMGVLNKEETTGKGGHRGVYSSKMNEVEFKKFIVETAIKAFMRSFPEETRRTIEKLS